MRLCHLSIFAGLMLGACASNQGYLSCHIAGGENIKIAMTTKGPAHASNKDVRIEAAAPFIGPGEKNEKGEDTKVVKYGFVFTELDHVAPKHVKVEDVTDKEAILLADDPAPKIDEKGFWHGASEGKTGDDKSLAWVHHLDASIRIYRFTITTADGRDLVMYEASAIPNYVKVAIKSTLEMK